MTEENVTSDGTLESAVTADEAFSDIVRIDLIFAHASAFVGHDEKLKASVPRDRWGRIVLYSSVGGSSHPDGKWPKDALWVIPAVTQKNPPSEDEVKEFKAWLEDGELPSLLRPAARLRALQRLSVVCQGYLAAWAAVNPDDRSLDGALDRLGWLELLAMTARNDDVGARLRGLVDVRRLAGEFTKTDGYQPTQAGWWQDLLGVVDDPSSRRSLKDDVLRETSSQVNDKVIALLELLAGDSAATSVEPHLVAEAFLQIADVLENRTKSRT